MHLSEAANNLLSELLNIPNITVTRPDAVYYASHDLTRYGFALLEPPSNGSYSQITKDYTRNTIIHTIEDTNYELLFICLNEENISASLTKLAFTLEIFTESNQNENTQSAGNQS